MTYTPTVWVNGSAPAINQTNLGKIEAELVALDTAVSGAITSLSGAVADAVCLTDATMTTGSAVLTSAAGAFASADVGKLIYVRCGLTLLKTTVASWQSATQITLSTNAPANSTIDGGPNVNAIYGTDNAAAFQAMFTTLQAAALPIADAQSRWRPRGAGFIPAGNYLVGSAISALTVSGITAGGAGRAATKIFFCEDASLLQMGAYSASPADPFGGTAYNFRLNDLTICNPILGSTSVEGSRVGAAIQDNGSGGVQLSDVELFGFKYGFYGTYGSDFTRFGHNTQLSQCDVGAYFGPGSQQVLIEGIDAFWCREGIVFEGAGQWSIVGSSFEDPTVAAVTIEAKATGTTRSGISVSIGAADYFGSWNIHDTWFESNAGASGRLAPRMVYISGVPPAGSPATGVVMVRDCFLVSGGTQVGAAHNCFMEMSMTNPGPNAIDNLAVIGNFINHIIRYSGAGSTNTALVTRTPLPTGSGITYSFGNDGSNIYEDHAGNWQGTFRYRQIIPGNPTMTFHQIQDGGGSGEIVRVRSASSPNALSGIAVGGGLFGATQSTTLASPGAVTMDASRANQYLITLQANATSSSITNPHTGQTLTIVWIQDGTGGRTYAWPTNCKFSGGIAPSTTTLSTRTSATFIYDGTNWYEIGRAVAVA